MRLHRDKLYEDPELKRRASGGGGQRERRRTCGPLKSSLYLPVSSKRTAITKAFAALRVLANVRSLAGMGSHMNFECRPLKFVLCVNKPVCRLSCFPTPRNYPKKGTHLYKALSTSILVTHIWSVKGKKYEPPRS